MFFVNAVCTSSIYGREHIAICADEVTEQFWSGRSVEGLTRVYYKRPIAQEIMKAAAKDILPTSFECNDVKYTLENYTYNNEERFYNSYRKNHIVRKIQIKRNKQIYVYSERCRCTVCYSEYGFDSIENICGIVKLKNDPTKSVEIDVQHCKHCDDYFIDSQSLAVYERKYGLLDIDKQHITGNETYQPRDFHTYSEDTILSRNGYSTRLYTSKRRIILSNLIDSGKSSKAEIKDILTRFISQRGERFPNAKAVWSDDLEYVNQYDFEEEISVQFE